VPLGEATPFNSKGIWDGLWGDLGPSSIRWRYF
jgi:hypothetical protein